MKLWSIRGNSHKLDGGAMYGNAPRAMGAEPGAWVWPQIVLEHRMAANRFRIGANVGYRLHGGDNPSFQNDSTGVSQLEEGKLKYGNMGTFGVALAQFDPSGAPVASCDTGTVDWSLRST